MAAAVIGAVVDSTSLEWDDPVEKWLPEFKEDAKGKILLRQLLSHTSGVRPYLPEPRVDNYNHLDSAIIEISAVRYGLYSRKPVRIWRTCHANCRKNGGSGNGGRV